MNVFSPSSFDQIVFTDAPSIGFIKKTYSVDEARGLVSLLLNWLCNQLSVGKSMDTNKIKTASEIIIDAFPQLTMMDLKLCFKKAISGEYGKLYDRLDGAVICEWLRQYFEDRLTYAENEQLKNHKKPEPFKVEPVNEEVFQKGIQMVLDALPKLDQEVKQSPNREDTYHHWLLIRWRDQFHFLCKDIGIKKHGLVAFDTGGINLLNIGGKYYDLQEFLKLKMNNYYINPANK